MLTHVYRRYNCECGQAWTTREVRVGSQEDKDKKLRGSIADRLMELVTELRKEAYYAKKHNELTERQVHE